MIIRPCERSDLQSVGDLWNQAIRETLITFNSVEKTAEDMADLLTEKRRLGQGFFVAENAGVVVGFAVYGQFRNGIGYAPTMEHSIFLSPGARGKGAGRALMTMMEDFAATSGVHSMWAGVSSANPAGRDFHAALGYAEIATLREVGYKWGRWLDLILMQKILQDPATQPGEGPKSSSQ